MDPGWAAAHHQRLQAVSAVSTQGPSVTHDKRHLLITLWRSLCISTDQAAHFYRVRCADTRTAASRAVSLLGSALELSSFPHFSADRPHKTSWGSGQDRGASGSLCSRPSPAKPGSTCVPDPPAPTCRVHSAGDGSEQPPRTWKMLEAPCPPHRHQSNPRPLLFSFNYLSYHGFCPLGRKMYLDLF